MTQFSLLKEESYSRGAKRTIKLPVIAANTFLQYTRNHDKLKSVNRKFGYFNQITVLNNGLIDIELALDYNANKTYPIPAESSISLDEIMYQEFNVKNLSATDDTVINKITVVATYENPLLRKGGK